MSAGSDRPSAVVLEVGDRAVAVIAARAALGTDGVSRLRPAGLRAVGRAVAGSVAGGVVRATRRAPAARTGGDSLADRDADGVVVDRDGRPAGVVGVALRITVTGEPAVLATVEAVQRRVADDLRRLAALRADVTVHVVGVEDRSVRGSRTRQ